MDKISPIKKRILQFIEYKGIAKTEFCEKASISYAPYIDNSLSIFTQNFFYIYIINNQ